MRQLEAALLVQRGHLFPWVPVCLAVGIGLFFGLGTEPPREALIAMGAGVLILGAISLRAGAVLGPIVLALALVAVGFVLAGIRAHVVAAPVLEFRYYGPVEGRIVGMDRSGSDALRLTLDRVVLEDVRPSRTPERVRVSLHGEQGFVDPQPGMRVMMTAHLSGPGGPVEPNGFDFQRHAWFLRLGAVGYTRTPVLAAAPPGGGQWVFALRMAMSERVRDVLPGDVGGFAAAVTTGDRSGISQEGLEALRLSNLAHLLAISGLHMGLLAGFVFAVLRYGLAAIPWIGLRVPAKKVAAALALVIAAFYLALSGGNVATERAYIMVAVALIAVMLDRRALSLRAVALAAIIVLVLRPEALLSPGFQMSFAATTALVVVFGWLRGVKLGPQWAKPATSVFISSAVAGLATAPIAAAHFNHIAHYGLIANLLSVPLMGILVMPAAVLAAILSLVGLEALSLWLMGLGLRWILGVAHTVSGLDGSVSYVLSPSVTVLPVLSLGALMVILWQGRARFAGLAGVFAAFGLWLMADRPAVLIAESGALVGVMTPEGRALSRARGGGFFAKTWLENDGDGAEQAQAADRWTWPGEGRRAEAPLGQGRIFHMTGKRAAEAFDTCAPADVVVLNVKAPNDLPCLVIDADRLRASGSIALDLTHGTPRMTEARQVAGQRIWNSRAARADAQAAPLRLAAIWSRGAQ